MRSLSGLPSSSLSQSGSVWPHAAASVPGGALQSPQRSRRRVTNQPSCIGRGGYHTTMLLNLKVALLCRVHRLVARVGGVANQCGICIASCKEAVRIVTVDRARGSGARSTRLVRRAHLYRSARCRWCSRRRSVAASSFAFGLAGLWVVCFVCVTPAPDTGRSTWLRVPITVSRATAWWVWVASISHRGKHRAVEEELRGLQSFGPRRWVSLSRHAPTAACGCESQ